MLFELFLKRILGSTVQENIFLIQLIITYLIMYVCGICVCMYVEININKIY